MTFNCYASCGFGVESVLAKELQKLGFSSIKACDGRVYFEADETDIAKANIFCRTAERIYIVLGQFKAQTFDELFENLSNIDFWQLIPSDARLPVNANAVNSFLMSVSDIQSISKKAISTSLCRHYKINFLPEDGNKFHIFINIIKNVITVALNTSGEGLNRRGYRIKSISAPMRETLAAALILISGWYKRDFCDPMCGGGTIITEAAMMAAKIAPGLYRNFDAQKYSNSFKRAFKDVREMANTLKIIPEMNFFASDINPVSVRITKDYAKNAGVGDFINFKTSDISDILKINVPLTIITNPPYAVRMSDDESVCLLYKHMGNVFKKLTDSKIFILCANNKFEKYYGIRADKKRKLYNGNLKCTYYQYFKKR